MKLIVANWKMNPETRREAKQLFRHITAKRPQMSGVAPVICPPFPYIHELAGNYSGSKFFFGAQDIFVEATGSFTGEVSPTQLRDAGARFVIVGHSERRALGESFSDVAAKTRAALAHNFHTIVCIGESTRDLDGLYLKFLKEELHASLEGVKKSQTKNLIIAYEPLWAIGDGGHAATPDDMHQMTIFIRRELQALFGKAPATRISILYGGSVDADNAVSFVTEGEADGLLIGRASLNPAEFTKILSSVSNVARS
jgi:triosephosphate isomerase